MMQHFNIFKLMVKDTNPIEPKKAKPAKAINEKTVHRTSNPQVSDDTIREVRWLSEFKDWTHAELAEHFNLKKSYISKLMTYGVRAKVIPEKDDFPADHGEKNSMAGIIEGKYFYRAYICEKGRRIHLGNFNTVEEAQEARKEIRLKMKQERFGTNIPTVCSFKK